MNGFLVMSGNFIEIFTLLGICEEMDIQEKNGKRDFELNAILL